MIQQARYLLFCCTFYHSISATLTSLSNNNPFPLYQTNLFDYVSLKERLEMAHDKDATAIKDHFFIGASFANQTATQGKRLNGKTFETKSDNPSELTKGYVPLGDIKGRTNLIAMLGGPTPQGQTLPQVLADAASELSITSTNFNETMIDPTEQFGCNTTELKYSKKSLLLSMQNLWWQGFGATLDTEIATIKQSIDHIINRTKDDTTQADLTSDDVNKHLMNKFNTIVAETHQSLTRPSKTGLGEIRLGLFWRNYFEINEKTKDDSWPHLLFLPFIHLQASASPDKTDPSIIFKAPLGNNGHYAVGLSGGFTFDFIDTIYFSAQGGYTHFFKRDIEKMPIPNNIYQKNLYPFIADVTVQPGGNWYVSGKIGSYHFIDKLSVFFEYAIMEHAKDKITLKKEDPAFIPSTLEDASIFKAKLFNLAFTYDIAPTISLGFTWQTPVSIRNAYRSSTLIFSINGLL